MPQLDGTVYVYGVMEQARLKRLPVRGVGGSDVTAVEHDGLIALTSHLTEPSLAARDLRAHWSVVESAFEKATVLPVRFGVALESEEAVRERVLDANAPRLRSLLRDMEGLAQLNVKGRYDEDELLREIVRTSRAVRELRERVRTIPDGVQAHGEQIRLGQLVSHEVTRWREHDAAAALGVLEPLAIATRSDEAPHPVAFNFAFLVKRDGRETFDEAVTTLTQELGPRVELRYIGPLPPYSFADAQLSTGSDEWA